MNPSPSSSEVLSWQEKARQTAYGIRLRTPAHTIVNNGGYLSQACSSAETFAVLYHKVMNIKNSAATPIPRPFPGVPSPRNTSYFTGSAYNGPHSPKLDRFYLSCVQYALVLYATLVETQRMSEQGLKMFNQDGSTVEMIGAEHSPGHEVTGGSLGQTISQVAGIAMGRRLKKETGRQWILMSDGEFQSGQTWEAIQSLTHYHLDNVAVYVDVNGQQCDGKMTDVMNIEPLDARLEAFGARVCKVDGHDMEALAAPAAWEPDGRPLFILAYTDPAHEMEEILEERKPKLHYVRFKNEAERERFRDFQQRCYPLS